MVLRGTETPRRWIAWGALAAAGFRLCVRLQFSGSCLAAHHDAGALLSTQRPQAETSHRHVQVRLRVCTRIGIQSNTKPYKVSRPPLPVARFRGVPRGNPTQRGSATVALAAGFHQRRRHEVLLSRFNYLGILATKTAMATRGATGFSRFQVAGYPGYKD